MCGAFDIQFEPFTATIANALDVASFESRGYHPPTSSIQIVRENGDGKREVTDAKWWLMFRNGKPHYKFNSFNIRYDNFNSWLTMKPARETRCIIPASGIIEGQSIFDTDKIPPGHAKKLSDELKKRFPGETAGGMLDNFDENMDDILELVERMPITVIKKFLRYNHYIKPVDSAFALGGLYKDYEHNGDLIRTAAVITCPGNSKLKSIHAKSVPLMLDYNDKETMDAWLDPTFNDIDSFLDLMDGELWQDLEAVGINKARDLTPVGEPFTIPADR